MSTLISVPKFKSIITIIQCIKHTKCYKLYTYKLNVAITLYSLYTCVPTSYKGTLQKYKMCKI